MRHSTLWRVREACRSAFGLALVALGLGLPWVGAFATDAAAATPKAKARATVRASARGVPPVKPRATGTGKAASSDAVPAPASDAVPAPASGAAPRASGAPNASRPTLGGPRGAGASPIGPAPATTPQPT